MGGEGVGGGLGEALERPLSPESRYDEGRIFGPEKERKKNIIRFSNHDTSSVIMAISRQILILIS